MPFEDKLPLADRHEAGRLLARELDFLRGAPGLIVLGLPRGGVPVAFEVAQALQAPLDVFLVRKIGMPGHPEFAAGALAAGGVQVMDTPMTPALRKVAQAEANELVRRERAYRVGRPPLGLQGHTVVLVDDGLATGATMEAAARAVRQMQPARLVVAAPVASGSASWRLTPWAETVFGAVPEPFQAVSRWYRDFPQTTDAEVRELLAAAQPAHA